MIAEVHGRGAHDLGLGDGEEDGVVGVDAAEDDGIGNADIGEGEYVIEAAGGDVAGLNAAVANGGCGGGRGLGGLELGLAGRRFGLGGCHGNESCRGEEG